MGRKCSVKDCKSDSQSPSDIGVTFHKVPFHSDIRSKWIKLCNIVDDKKIIYVCSRHFIRADFCSYKGAKYMLRQGALPSIFSWSTSDSKDNIKGNFDTSISEVSNNTVEVKSKIVKLESKTTSKMLENSSFDRTKTDVNMDPNSETLNIMKPLHIKTEATDVKEEILSPSSTIEQTTNIVNTSTGKLLCQPNARIEALDFNQVWRPAKILEVDFEENEVLVHFDMYSSKYDEWIGIYSHSIRAVPAPGKNKFVEKENETLYQTGERCMASWSDARKFPATITKVIDKSTYEVLFDDGYSKTLKSHRISKCSTTSPPTSPLFHPVSSTKEERRNKKRKHNVKSLFARKRNKTASLDGALDIPLLQEVPPKSVIDAVDEWVPKWENQRPVGQDSYLFHNDGYRKSVIITDPRLPENYEKHLVQRTLGQSVGKWDVIIVTPEGKKLRGKAEALKYIEENPELNLKESMFDFAVNEKSKRRKRPLSPQQEMSPKDESSSSFDNLNLLKIRQVAGGYVCPIEGCGKKFRRENLAQMHVKHYHPEYTKFLDSTPNVADLAYARTVGENLDRSPSQTKEKILKPKQQITKTTFADVSNETDFPKQEQTKDSEIIRLLNSKPFDSLDVPQIEPLPSGLPPSMYPDIKLKDLLSKSEPIPKVGEINFKMIGRSSAGLKMLLPVKRDNEAKPTCKRDALIKKKKVTDIVESTLGKSEDVHSFIEEETQVESPAPTVQLEPNIIIEGGEVIKIVRMKQEEIINCTCGITEEDGLMIQCELCLCWQHAYCNNIQRENEVPDKYICYICQNPAKERASRKYHHDQDWMKLGTLPNGSYHCKDDGAVSKEFSNLKTSHDLSGGLLELKNYMKSINLKIKIAETKNHPKLYLWSKAWDKTGLPENEPEFKVGIKNETEFPAKTKEHQDSLLFNILKGGKIKEETQGFPPANSTEQMSEPQPLHPIITSDCKFNLIEHIAHCQMLVEERLNNIENDINNLDPSILDETNEDYARIMNTTTMLVRDLNTLKDLSQVATF